METKQRVWHLPQELKRLKEIAQQIKSQRSGTPPSRDPALKPPKREDKSGG
jgi:hypothetical protein